MSVINVDFKHELATPDTYTQKKQKKGKTSISKKVKEEKNMIHN